MKANVFLIDSIHRKVIERYRDDDPAKKAEEVAKGYFEKGEGNPIHKFIPTKKYPNRWGILTPTDYFVHYLTN